MSLLGPLHSYQQSTLEPLIESATNARYPELYEAADHRPAQNLEQVTEGILNALGDPQTDHQAWRRFGHMGRALLIEVIPTIAGHWPAATPKANSVLATLEAWLSSSSSPPPVHQDIDGPLAPQALAEAIDVVRNAVRLTDRAHARRAIADMVDDCLQGYAIVPGSEGRRSVFNWWLHVVVPAAWALQRSARFDAAAPQP